MTNSIEKKRQVFLEKSLSNDNFSFTDKVKNDVDSLTFDEINYIISLGTKSLNSNNLSDKITFILTISKFLNISMNQDILLDGGFLLETLTEFLKVQKNIFVKNYPGVYYFLNTESNISSRLNLVIEILIGYIDNPNIEINLSEIHKKVLEKVEIFVENILFGDLEDSDINDENIYFFLNLIANLGFYKSLPEEAKDFFRGFLEEKYLEYLKNNSLSGQTIGYELLRRSIVSDANDSINILQEIFLLVSNYNCSNGPLIIGFNIFPGDKYDFLIYQDKPIMSPKEGNTNTQIFTGDKKGFINELYKLKRRLIKELFYYGKIFSISVYKKIGGKTRPPMLEKIAA